MHFGPPMMIIENDDSQHHRGRHHEHDAIEIGACIIGINKNRYRWLFKFTMLMQRSGIRKNGPNVKLNKATGLIDACIFRLHESVLFESSRPWGTGIGAPIIRL